MRFFAIRSKKLEWDILFLNGPPHSVPISAAARPLGAILGRLRAILGLSWGLLGPLGASWGPLGAYWGLLGPLGAIFKPSCSHHEAMLEAFWLYLGSMLGPAWSLSVPLEAIIAPVGASYNGFKIHNPPTHVASGRVYFYVDTQLETSKPSMALELESISGQRRPTSVTWY